MRPSLFAGVNLTDSNVKTPRAVNMAVLLPEPGTRPFVGFIRTSINADTRDGAGSQCPRPQ